MKKTAITLAGAMALAAPASAHTGDHSMSFVTAVAHWLSSPSHAIMTVAAAAVIVGLAVKIARNKA